MWSRCGVDFQRATVEFTRQPLRERSMEFLGARTWDNDLPNDPFALSTNRNPVDPVCRVNRMNPAVDHQLLSGGHSGSALSAVNRISLHHSGRCLNCEEMTSAIRESILVAEWRRTFGAWDSTRESGKPCPKLRGI